MKILNLKLLNFRNYESLNINFDLSKNLIIGKNGMGKTNIIEAIYVLGLTKSFRGSKESVVIRRNTDLARVEGTIESTFKNDYKVIIKNNEKKVKINNNNIDKISEYISKINIVLFTSEDLKLVKDTPNTRRKLINIEISQLSNEYLKLLTYYNKILKQRNAYLKIMYINANAKTDYLDILTNQLIEIGLKIYNFRKDFIKNISKYITKNYLKITGNDNLILNYISDYNDKSKEDIIKLYKKYQKKDIILGKTSIGVHRDDYDFLLDNNSLKDYGSEEEKKNAVIALKMAEVEIFKVEKNDTPILILDDLFSELDEVKINNIISFINNDIQTFITTTELDKLNDDLIKNSKIFEVNNGSVSERGD